MQYAALVMRLIFQSEMGVGSDPVKQKARFTPGNEGLRSMAAAMGFYVGKINIVNGVVFHLFWLRSKS